MDNSWRYKGEEIPISTIRADTAKFTYNEPPLNLIHPHELALILHRLAEQVDIIAQDVTRMKTAFVQLETQVEVLSDHVESGW